MPKILDISGLNVEGSLIFASTVSNRSIIELVSLLNTLINESIIGTIYEEGWLRYLVLEWSGSRESLLKVNWFKKLSPNCL